MFNKQTHLILMMIPLLATCGSLIKPNFKNMSDDELATYNSTIASQEQIKCVNTQINFDQSMQKVCGTLSEIQELTRPQGPGARNQGANPRFLNDIETQSRPTNPSLRPVTQPRPF
jgi:hypothetical protein